MANFSIRENEVNHTVGELESIRIGDKKGSMCRVHDLV